MAANRAAIQLSPAGLQFRTDLNQTGKQLGLKNAAQNRTLLRDLLTAAGWTAQAPFSSHPCPVILLNGEKRSPTALTLNPAFTDWMMGWPPGWTDPLQPVTGLSGCRQRALGAC